MQCVGADHVGAEIWIVFVPCLQLLRGIQKLLLSVLDIVYPTLS